MPPPFAFSQASPSNAARDDAHDWLMGRINYERAASVPYHERQLKLDRMRQLLNRLGNPDAGMQIVHVAGTKGKGSTAAMIGAVLSTAGYRTGVFSSPHFERIEERFAVDGQLCPADQFVALVDRLRPVVAEMDKQAAGAEGETGPTYFEVTTALALLHFSEQLVDAAVLEVGLGGRLDSTNVCLPVVSVITSISFDHTRQLGSTLAAIAREKAGIIKPGVPVVSGVQDEEPREVITHIAREHGCRLIQAGRDFDFRGATLESACDERCAGVTFDFHALAEHETLELSQLRLSLLGRHQAANAAVALATLVELQRQGWRISEPAIRHGIEQCTLPGRVEPVGAAPRVIVDTAHNVASVHSLVDTLAELPLKGRRWLILSVSHDKDVRGIVGVLAQHFERFIVTQYQENPRAVAAQQLAEMLQEELGEDEDDRVQVVVKPSEAWQQVKEACDDSDLVCITGSFYLAAEMRRMVIERSGVSDAAR